MDALNLKMFACRKLTFLFFLLVVIGNVIVAKEKSKSKWKKYFHEIEEAMKNYTPCKGNCTCHAGVIDSDLEYWRNHGGITREDIDRAVSRGVHYQILDHKLYRQSECMFPTRCSGIEHFIVGVLEDLPDMELVINVRDWPQTQKRDANPLPIFSFSKVDAQHRDIMYPAWTFWEGGPAVWPIYPRGLGRWDEMRNELKKKSKEWPWDKKIDIAFFRGSRTSALRDPLILLSRYKPELADAQYTKNQAWKSDKDTLGATPAEPVHLNEHCQYKYLFNFRGVAASFRLKHLFLCNSLVFHVGEDWIEFFYLALKPWIHYIPLPDNLSNLEELLEFARDNDELMERIASRGRKFIVNHLKMSDVSCYWKKLLQQYSKLLKFDIKKDESYNRITRKSNPTTRKKKEEL